MNKVCLTGRLTKAPELRKTNSGKSYMQFSLAVRRPKSKNSEGADADFISCQAWESTAELINTYCGKGSQLGLTGRISTRSYDDPNISGRKQYVTEVIVETIDFLESKEKAENNDLPSPQVLDINEDDLPF